MNARRIAATALACALTAGCATSRRSQEQASPKRYITYYDHHEQQESRYYWGKTGYICLNREPSGDAESWCEIANDQSRRRQARSAAGGLLFAAYVQAGFTSEMMRKAIPDPRWLKSCTVYLNEIVGGRWPYCVSSGSHFTLLLFPDKNAQGYDCWRIDFTLSRGTPRDFLVSYEEAVDFLNGTLADKSVEIEEFIMMYPLPGTLGYVEEMHNRRGVGVFIYPGAWFEFE